MQVPTGDAATNSSAIDVRAEELTQWRVVEHRLRRREQHTSRDERQHPVEASAQHVHRIDMKNLVGMEVCPDALQTQNGTTPLMSLRGQYGRGDAARGGPDDHLKRIASPRQQLSQRKQHANLVGRAGATARQDEADRLPTGSPALRLRFRRAVHQTRVASGGAPVVTGGSGARTSGRRTSPIARSNPSRVTGNMRSPINSRVIATDWV